MIPDPYRAVMRIDVGTGSTSSFLVRPGWTIYDPKYSPDAQWLVFSAGPGAGPGNSELRPYIVKLENGTVATGANWITASAGDERGGAIQPRWSPDGNTLYYLSHRDGFRCLWAQRLRPATKAPVDDPIGIYHFHDNRLSPRNVPLAVLQIDLSTDKMVITLAELTGNIWMLRGAR